MIQQDTREFLEWLRTQIPLLNHMGLGSFEQDNHGFSLSASLEPNINDKGTGFGGSLATLATITGWSYVTLLLRDDNFDCDVMIRDTEMRYTAPVQGDFRAVVQLPSQADAKAFLDQMSQRGKSRLTLDIRIMEQDKEALRMTGTYVAINRQ